METVILIALAMAVSLAMDAVAALITRWGQRKLPQTAQAEMSETDKEKIEATQELIKECFGDDVIERIKTASNKERIALMAEFAERLAKEYGLDIEVDVTVTNANTWGAYNWTEKKAVFNIALLMIDKDDKNFEHIARETLDTIIHELRHAVQHRAANEPGFWNVSDERRQAWAINMTPGHYIRPEVNMRAYANQPVEKDAVTFAALVLEGVH